MKNLLIGLTALAFVASTAQANDRLARCVKNLRNIQTTLQSTEAELSQCRLNNVPGNGQETRRLRRELRQTREELRLCRQITPTPDFGETARLRRELQQARQDLRLAQEDNRFLRQSNDDLRIRLEECEGQNPPFPNNNGYFCSAACTTSNGKTDLRYLGGAEAMFELEAESQAISKTQSDYRCSWGVKKVSCQAQSFEAANYCVAACTKSNGQVDMRYSKGASGRSTVEAEYNALKETQKAYRCSWGVEVSNCN
ncbi:MAG: hypothetical protein CME70_08800 [Halobacteriovorax sp.]|nr:hypothetical protein [Halobacteriovorax sp.]|tara:strand:+ start:86622 stop:87386 length:765 start_codon:yes stop_codon:yes gene_type:complete